MKKFIYLLVTLLISAHICCAATKIPKNQIPAYRQDMTQVINSILDDKNIEGLTYREYFIKAYNNELNWYENVFRPDKNQMKRNYDHLETMNEKTGKINSYAYFFTDKFQPVLDKYNLELDGRYNTFEYIDKNYLKKYKIERSNEFMNLVTDSWTAVCNIADLRTSIEKYSREYENKKAENFYNKFVAPKVEANSPLNIMVYLTQVGKFDTTQLYYGNPKVMQIVQGGFLADFAPYDYSNYINTIVFVKASDAYKLKHGDYFDPYLPLKFTGQYYTYRNMVGERKTVPVFTIVLKTNKSITIPEMADKFYFIEKPNWKNQIKDYSLDSLYVINERRIFDNKDRSPYYRYR